MKKEEFIKEKANLLKEVETLQSESIVELETAVFLTSQVHELLDKIDSTNDFEERELLYKQVEALDGKLLSEIRTIEKGKIKLEKISDKHKVLCLLEQQGLIED